MKKEEIEQLIRCEHFMDEHSKPILVETHISWVILAGQYAYKIKKPVRFSFLDFSSLKKRKYYCERELILNKRLAEQMYLSVIPIFKKGIDISLNQDGAVIDYAVLMKRMDAALEMDKLLIAGKVNEQAIEKLAAKIAAFHRSATVITNKTGIDTLKKRFNDLEAVLPFVQHHPGNNFSGIIRGAVKKSDAFLNKYQSYITERATQGYIRDGHGDLHSGNIFLYQDPVVFDCIEFNDEMRQIDILDEIAFLCMDLDAYGRRDLSRHFYQNYLEYSGINETENSALLFHYYKCYRANIRAKINLLNAIEATGEAILNQKTKAASNYLSLLENYLSGF
jgi:aminoglycoside phosphotransferase family enzyme